VNWPARSPDLDPLDFYSWGHLSSLVLQHKREQCRRIQTTPGIFERVRRSTKICVLAESGHFEQFL
ncbi:hypothetical protein WH47_09299, partial [Habropoda laboriosa]